MVKTQQKIDLGIWLIVAFVFTLIGCDSPILKEKIAIETYPIFTPIEKDTVYYKDYIADIQASQYVEVRSRVKGYIEKMHIDEGMRVKKGQLLFSLTNQEYKEDLMKAKAILKNAIAEAKTAELDYYNAKLLEEKEVISQTEVDMAQAKLEAKNAKVDEAKSKEVSALLSISFTKIKAPFDGVVNRIPNKKGSLIDEGDLLTTISNNRHVNVYFNMSEKEYLEFAKTNKVSARNSKVSLLMANNTLHPQEGVIETVEGEVNKYTGNIAFRAKFSNQKNLLKQGSTGKIRMKTQLKNVLMIPQKSTFEIQDQVYVYALDSTNTVYMKAVVSRLRIPHFFIIESGLSLTDRIVFEGIQTVKDGMKIVPDTVLFTEVLDKISL